MQERRIPIALTLSALVVLLLSSCDIGHSGTIIGHAILKTDNGEVREITFPWSDPKLKHATLSLRIPQVQGDGRIWLHIGFLNSKAEVKYRGVSVFRYGDPRDATMQPDSRDLLAQIAPGLDFSGGYADVEVELWAFDELSVPAPEVFDRPDQAALIGFRNFMNNEINGVIALLCLLVSLLYMRVALLDRSHLYRQHFSISTFLFAVHFFSYSGVSAGIDYTMLRAIGYSMLFPAIAHQYLFIRCLFGHPRKSEHIAILVAGWLSLVLLIAEHDNYWNGAYYPFLVLWMIVFGSGFAFLLYRYFKGDKSTGALVIGAMLSMACGVFDVVVQAAGVEPFIWLEGIGAFVFIMFLLGGMSIQSEVRQLWFRSYQDSVEQEVSRRTDQLHKTNLELVEANHARSEFLAHVSHELKTPMHCVLGFSQVLDSKGLQGEAGQLAHRVHTETLKLNALLDQLLQFSTIEKQHLRIVEEVFSPLELVEELSRIYEARAFGKGLSFEFVQKSKFPDRVFGDRARIHQVIAAILDNAVKFSSQGRILFAVDLRNLGEQAHELSVLVEDQGIGIKADLLEKVMQSFEQGDTSPTRRFGGLGLGLSISQRLSELLHARLLIESEDGKGTRVRFIAPLGVHRLSKPGATIDSPRDILIVEDYAANREVLQLFLKQLGFSADEAEDGNQAIQACSSKDYRLILMDMHMPDMDGCDATAHIRKLTDARGAKPQILGLTADNTEETRERCLAAGMDDVLTKPLRIESLSKVLAKSPVAPVVQPEPDEDGILDFGALKDSLAGAEEHIPALVEGFFDSGKRLITSLRGQIAEVKAADSDELWNLVHRNAHTLKGAALNLFASRLSEASRDLEVRAKARDAEGAAAAFSRLEAVWELVCARWESIRGGLGE